MAWQRFWQSGFEDKYLATIDSQAANATFGQKSSFFNDTPFTGNHSLNVVKNPLGPIWNSPSKHLGQDVEQLRCSIKAYLIAPNNGFRILSVNFIQGIGLQDVNKVFWFLDPTGVWKFYAQNVLVATVSPYLSGFSTGQWETYAAVAKAGVDGFVSFYHNGVLAYKHTAYLTDSFNSICFPNDDNIGNGPRMDDVYIDIADGFEPDEVPNSYRFFPLSARAEGGHSDWITMDNGLDKVAAANNQMGGMEKRTGFWANAIDQVQTFKTTDVRGHDEYEINAICVQAVGYAGADVVSPTLEVLLDDGVNQAVSPAKPLTWAYNTLGHRFSLRPDGQPWERDFDDVEFGFRS